MTHSQSGHTLFELLLTLSILSILLLLPLISFQFNVKDYTHEQIADQFLQDVLLAQHLAISSGSQVRLRIESSTNEYRVQSFAGELLVTRPFPVENMYFETSSLPNNSIIFLSNGNPRYSGTMFLYVGDDKYGYTVTLGKGRVNYRKI
ncbi:competence type IV pilus minor pilin ComGD [Bacillus sp. FJAT-45037]|uniref:competence type IV pilus minor pilin ComGD n=1 Tax=Bacillus sp. FJAT-45037 TaxID=2011007 RepID=UPI000C23997E|nr:competence type IV pilus minor pilin ComGD [Bacillus sp. FJAT-45037]